MPYTISSLALWQSHGWSLLLQNPWKIWVILPIPKHNELRTMCICIGMCCPTLNRPHLIDRSMQIPPNLHIMHRSKTFQNSNICLLNDFPCFGRSQGQAEMEYTLLHWIIVYAWWLMLHTLSKLFFIAAHCHEWGTTRWREWILDELRGRFCTIFTADFWQTTRGHGESVQMMANIICSYWFMKPYTIHNIAWWNIWSTRCIIARLLRHVW